MTELEPRRSGLEQLAEVVRQIGETFGRPTPPIVQAHAERVERRQLPRSRHADVVDPGDCPR